MPSHNTTRISDVLSWRPGAAFVAAAVGLGASLLAASALASPPRALWSPVSASAERSGVFVTFKGDTSEDGRIPIELQNALPFSVEVRDLEQCRGVEEEVAGEQVRSERCYALLQPLILEANSRTPSELRFASHRRTEEASLLGVRMGLMVAPGVPAQLHELLSLLDVPGVTWSFEELRSAQALSRFVAAEWGAAGAAGYPRAELEALLPDAQALARALPERVCAHERALVLESLGGEPGRAAVREALRRFEQFMAHAPPGSPQRGCVGEEVLREVVAAELEHGERYRAVALSQEYDRGAETPEPFRTALLGEALERLERHRALPDRLLAQKAMIDVHTFAPEHPETARWMELMRGLAQDAVTEAQDYAFGDAYYALESLTRGVERMRRAPLPTLPLAEELLRETSSAVAWERARYQYHYKLHEEGMIEAARQSFEEARAHAPVMTQLYLVGIVFFEHQFSILFVVLLSLGAMILLVRSRTFWRWRMGAALWRAQALAWSGRRHASREAFWFVLNQVLANARGAQPDLKLQAHAASGVLEQARLLGDVHEVAEVSKHFVGLESLYRPGSWGAPTELLQAAATVAPTAGRPDLARLEANRRLIQELFPDTPEAKMADALLSEARCRLSRDEEREACYAEATARYEVVLAADGLTREVSEGARQRLGVLAAQLGPSSEGPERAWRRAWEALREERAEPGRGVSADGLIRARAMAAAAGGSTREAIEALTESAPTLEATEAGQELLCAALLCAARRAELPLAQPGEPRESASDALKALAELDNMLTARVRGAEELDARLRLAILRRVGGAAMGLREQDVEYEGDLEALLARARESSHRATTRVLASVLDVLTPGDWGFDAYAEAARGVEGALFALLRALDAHVQGQELEAAAALANINPDEPGLPEHVQVRLLATRALVAAAVGQARSARTALGRAASRAVTARDEAVVDVTAARLLGVLFEGSDPCEDAKRGTLWVDGVLLAHASRGFMRASVPEPPLPWSALGRLLAERGQAEAAVQALERSAARSDERSRCHERAIAWRLLCHRAFLSYDYDRASRYAAHARREAALEASDVVSAGLPS